MVQYAIQCSTDESVRLAANQRRGFELTYAHAVADVKQVTCLVSGGTTYDGSIKSPQHTTTVAMRRQPAVDHLFWVAKYH